MIRNKPISYWINIFLPTISMIIVGLFWELFGWLLFVVIQGNDSWIMQGYISLIMISVSLFWSLKNYLIARKFEQGKRNFQNSEELK